MVIIYEAYFKISLYPDGIKGFHFEEKTNEFGVKYAEFVNNCKNFNSYLCTDSQSTYVLKYLKTIYKKASIAGVTITDLIYETTGRFNCNVGIFCDEDAAELKDEEIGEIIENTLWPTDEKDGITIIICGETYSIDICLDYFVYNGDGNESDSEKLKVEELEAELKAEEEAEEEKITRCEEEIQINLDKISDLSNDDDSEYGDDSVIEEDLFI